MLTAHGMTIENNDSSGTVIDYNTSEQKALEKRLKTDMEAEISRKTDESFNNILDHAFYVFTYFYNSGTKSGDENLLEKKNLLGEFQKGPKPFFNEQKDFDNYIALITNKILSTDMTPSEKTYFSNKFSTSLAEAWDYFEKD